MRVAFLMLFTLASIVSSSARALVTPSVEHHFLTIDELKMQKRFGIGVAVGGPLAMLGIEADVNLAEQFSLTAGFGTGIDYSTLELKGRYFLPGRVISPYFGFGFARWWTDGTKGTSVGPSLLSKEFLPPGTDLTKGFNVFLMYPTFGAQYVHSSGFSFSIEAQYLFRLLTFTNGLYAGAGVHWYF